jgi:hypothetical protein
MLLFSGQCTEQNGTPHWLQRLLWRGALFRLVLRQNGKFQHFFGHGRTGSGMRGALLPRRRNLSQVFRGESRIIGILGQCFCPNSSHAREIG